MTSKENVAKAKEESDPLFRCLQGREKKSGDYKECEKNSAGARRYCVRGTSLEGKDKGETFYGCYSIGDITGDYGFTKTIEETLKCEETKHQSGEKYEFCACSTDLCNAASTASKVGKRNIEII